MRFQQIRNSSFNRRADLHLTVENACKIAMELPYQDGVPPRKWDKAKKVFCKKLQQVVKKMDQYDDYSIGYFEARVQMKMTGGVLKSVHHNLHKFIGL